MNLFQSQAKFNLETAVGSQKSAQALGAPGKIKKCRTTTEVTTTFFISPCTPISYTCVLRPTAVSRFKASDWLFRKIHSSLVDHRYEGKYRAFDNSC